MMEKTLDDILKELQEAEQEFKDKMEACDFSTFISNKKEVSND